MAKVGTGARTWGARAAAGATVVAVATLALPALAHAGPMSAGPHRVVNGGSKAMVRVVTVSGFGAILETRQRLPLYVDTAPPCTAGCLAIWPPLLMPSGKTVPTGSTCLGTTPFGSQLQVTYNGQPVYTFLSDTKKHPPTGNGVESFAVVPVPGAGC